MWTKGRVSNPVFGQHFIDTLDTLTKLNLINTVTRGYRFSQRARQPTTVRPAAALANHLPVGATNWISFRLEDEPELIVLKKPKRRAHSAGSEAANENGAESTVNYRETRNTQRWRREIQFINSCLRDAPIEIVGDPSAVRLDRDGQAIDPLRRQLRRIFNNGDWRQGGRIWGGFWMNMERADRFNVIRIDGKPIANVDFNSLFPRLAYVRARQEQPEGDLYDINGDGSCRDGWKKLINALLFADRPLKQWPNHTREEFPPGTKVRDAVAAIKKRHRTIASLFEQGIGFRLMRIEADILISVVTQLFKAGITAAPLHDSVLVARSNADAVKRLMEAEFTRHTGSVRAFVKVEETPN
jgi:hypothetical protein